MKKKRYKPLVAWGVVNGKFKVVMATTMSGMAEELGLTVGDMKKYLNRETGVGEMGCFKDMVSWVIKFVDVIVKVPGRGGLRAKKKDGYEG